MGRPTKKAKAAKLREASKKLARKAFQVLPYSLGQPAGHGPWPSQVEQILPDQSKSALIDNSVKLEPDIKLHIKEEPFELEVNPFEPGHLEEVKVELVETMEEEADPIGSLQTGSAEPLVQVAKKICRPAVVKEDLYKIRCQFCLKLLGEAGGRGAISRKKIVFVLGVRKWGSPRERPNCCKGCKRMFDLFYDFKRSCLTALARPEFLLACVEKNVSNDVLVSRPIILSVSTKTVNSCPKKTQQQIKFPQPKEEKNNSEGDDISEPKIPSGSTQSSDDDSDIEFDSSVGEAATVHSNVNSEISDRLASDDTHPADEADTKQVCKKKNKERKYCYRCKQFYATEPIYDEHKPTCTKPARDPPPLACPDCPKRFNREDKLKLHINKHNGVRTIPCRREGCTKMFFDTNYRKTHEMSCGQDVQVICSVCAAIFRSKGALNAHMATHGEPKWTCDLCDKAFHTNARLKKHKGVHSEERKFVCKVCGKGFKSYEANRVHQRIHTQEKPYICHICGMAFTYNCLLKTHLEKGHDQYELNPKDLMTAAKVLDVSGDYL